MIKMETMMPKSINLRKLILETTKTETKIQMVDDYKMMIMEKTMQAQKKMEKTLLR